MSKPPSIGPGSYLEMYGSDDEESPESSTNLHHDRPPENPATDSHDTQQNAGTDLFTPLPPELKDLIAEPLPGKDLLNLSHTSKPLRQHYSPRVSDLKTVHEDSDLSQFSFQDRPARLENVLNALSRLHPADQSRPAARLSRNLPTNPIPQDADHLKKRFWSQVVKMPVDAHVLETTEKLDLLWFQPEERAAKLNEILDVHETGIQQGLMPKTFDTPLAHAASQITKLPENAQQAARERVRSLLSANGMGPGDYDALMLA